MKKFRDSENMIHSIKKSKKEFWVETEIFKVDFENKKASGKSTAKFGPYNTEEDAIKSIKAVDPSAVEIIDVKQIQNKGKNG